MSSIYQKLWVQHNGPIPMDKDGRLYDIHHKDGNHTNNDITNLQCVPMQEHYDIHYKQHDWGACQKFLVRFNISPEEKRQLTSLQMKAMIAKGIHPFQQKSYHQKYAPANNKARIAKGNHPFVLQFTCPKCGKIGQKSNMMRWHVPKCQ